MAFGFKQILQGLRIVPKTTSTVNSAGDLDFDTTSNKVNLHNGVSSSPVVTEAHTATLTNKTISGASNTLSNVPAASLTGAVAIANGGTGQTAKTAAFNALSPVGAKGGIVTHDGTDNVVLPPGTDGQLLVIDSTQTTGLAYKYISGVKNYITNGDAEATTNGWATYADAAGSLPVDGTGGTATAFAFSRNTTNPLRGTASFLIAKTNTNGQGQGVSYDFTIDAADQANILNISFDYKIASGTYADGDLTCYIYDVTNAQIIQPAGFTITNTTAYLTQTATFQANSDSTSYRLILHMASTSALGYSIRFDNVIVGPGIVVNGAAETDTVLYTPVVAGLGTGSGTVTAAYSRVGDKAKGIINFTKDGSAGTGGATVTFSLPAGLSINAAVYGVGSIVGSAQVTASQPGTVFVASSTTLGIYSPGTVVGSNILATGLYQLNFEVPIQGWSSNVQLSSDTDTRVVAASYTKSSGTALPNASLDVLVFDTKVYDTHQSYNSSTGYYTVPVSGKYRISAFSEVSASSSGHRELIAVKNSAELRLAYLTTGTLSASGPAMMSGNASFDCVAGDLLAVKIYQDSGGTLTTAGDGATFNHIEIERISGPSIIAASETVAAKYQDSTGSTYPRATNVTAMIFPNKIYDTHGAYNSSTGNFTVPVSGKYKLDCMFRLVTGSQISAVSRFILNGTEVTEKVTGQLETVFGAPSFSLSDTLDLIAGDVLNVGLYYNDGGGSDRPLIASGKANWISFLRVGN